ncbi:hypothetical protein TYRP_011656 [Tyrophagus putrescentiae]|nr:hypothetical protein TYRP_011656 [Tyrophagus putrescentiae]
MVKRDAESALEEGILKSITLYDVDYSRRRRKEEEDQGLPPPSPLSLKRQSSKCSKNAAPTELTAFELEQIAFVGQGMSAFVDESTCPNVLVATSLAQCFQMPEVYIRWAIKFCKRFPAFSELSAANQFSIFKNFAYDILTLRMVFCFDLERNGALMFTTDAADEVLFVNFDLASEMKNTDLCKQQIDYCLKLYDGLEKDRTIHDLLSAQQLFANRSKAPLALPEYFHYQHCFYSRLLRRYLESKHGLVLGRKKYSKLAELTAELDALKESEVQMYKTELDLTTLPAVFLELYNLCT